jgi:dolichol-phosphate mannosyltransferase
VIENIWFESDDFLAGTELLVKAMRAGYTVSEYPTTLHVRTFGQSSIRIAKVTMLHLKFQWRLLLATLTRQDLNARPPQTSKLMKGQS